MFKDSITPVILCGGKGSRLWPLSRESFPKQFLAFNKNKRISKGEIYFKNSNRFNPAFDITPSKYVTKLITENGVIKPSKSEIIRHIKNETNKKRTS